MTRIIDPLTFIADPDWLDSQLTPAWEVAVRAIYGLGLASAEQHELYELCTGRRDLPAQEPSTLAWICGRRSRKTEMLKNLALYEIATGGYEHRLARGERGFFQLVFQDMRAARRIGYQRLVATVERSPMLSRLVESVATEEIRFTNGLGAITMPASARQAAGRGYATLGAGFDEVGVWRVEGVNPDEAVRAAVWPSIAQMGGKLFLVGTPYSKSGLLWSAFREHWGHADALTFVWRAATRTMNTDLPEALITADLASDPEAARREWLAEWTDTISAAFPSQWIDAVVVPGRYELGAETRMQYVGAVDPSGAGEDHFTFALCHAHRGVVIQDVMCGWGRRHRGEHFDLESVVAEIAGICRAYRVQTLVGDKYAGDWPSQAFARHHLRYEPSPKPKAETYLEFQPLLAQGKLELLDHPRMVRELRTLERRRGPQGKDVIDHERLAGAHDDYPNALALAAVTAVAGRGTEPAILWGGEFGDYASARQRAFGEVEG